ncbi:hypothetical protein HY417_02090 [Candidatus Kaiserbacteria bacterium]|nr:hypothetical protein [Candidatus Kaiserbacteria bacterium]
MTPLTDTEMNELFTERLKSLPKVVRDAITSVDLKKQLQELANKHKLHLDQWQLLENEVMLTLLGFDEPEKLQENIKREVNVTDDVATNLALDISHIVYEPIRQELERQLEHPEAKEKELTGVEQAREQALTQRTENREQRIEKAPIAPAPPMQPATPSTLVAAPEPPALTIKPIPPPTPPPPPPTERAVRAPTSSVYKAGESSAARKEVHEDPYREPPA